MWAVRARSEHPETGPERESVRDRSGWASLLRERFVALDLRDAETDGFRGEAVTWALGHLMLGRVSSLPQTLERSRTLVRADSRAYLQVGRIRAGRAVVRQDGREAVLGPGDFVVYETTRPFEWAFDAGETGPAWELDVFTWPRETIALAEADSVRITATAMRGGDGLSGIVSRMLGDLLTVQPALDGPRSAALADEVGDLVSVLTSNLDPAEVRRPDVALMAQIDRYIDDHLDDPDLTPETVARAHAVSLRQLHRLFASRQHTVARTIRTRRLEQCRRDLVSPRSAHRSVTDIALRWGFLDLGAFGRAFREAYGVSPFAYRAGGARPLD